MPKHFHDQDIAHTHNGSLKFEGELYNFPTSAVAREEPRQSPQ